MAIYSPWGHRVGHNWVHANTYTRNSVWPEIWAMMEKEFWQTPWGKLGEAPDHHLRAPHFIHRQWGATGFWAETWQVLCSPGHRVQGGQGEPSSSADTLSSMEVDGCAPHTYSGPTYRLRRNSSLSLETRALYSSRSSLGALFASGKVPTFQCRRHNRCRFDPWVGRIPWKRTRQPTPVLLPRESHGQRSLEGHSP